jgi:two-component system CheB/CheR fusion protein
MVWNRGAEDLWGLREDEVRGKHIFGLDIGLPVERLKQPIRSCLSGTNARVDLRLAAINRRGRAIDVLVSTSPLLSRSHSIHGVVVLMEISDDQSTNGNGKRPGGRKAIPSVPE